MKTLRMWPCKDIDFSWSDVGYAVRVCISAFRRRSKNRGFPIQADGAAFFCISVRAAFDLYLSVRAWEQGDECVFVGINVPDMFRIAESHGLRVLGVDIDPITTEVDLEQLEASIKSNTRFIVVPHLFGHRLDLRSVVELASQHGLDVVEDCAQAFAGKHWWGTKGVVLSLFSFGPMKTATALQGAVAIVRDPSLSTAMKRTLATYPVQPGWRYFLRIVRFGAMKVATQPLIFGALIRTLQFFRIDHESIIHASTKSTASTSFERWLRAQPCTALICVISRQINKADASMQLRISKGLELESAIREDVPLVLRNRQPNVFWIVQVLVDDPVKLKDALRVEGFDAMSGRLVAMDGVKMSGTDTLEKAVILPFWPRMKEADVQRLGNVVSDYFAETSVDP